MCGPESEIYFTVTLFTKQLARRDSLMDNESDTGIDFRFSIIRTLLEINSTELNGPVTSSWERIYIP